MSTVKAMTYLNPNTIYHGDSRHKLKEIAPDSIALSVWSPPYHVGKEYEKDYDYAGWVDLLAQVIAAHFPIIKPGGFLAINIADILAFPDKNIPRFQAANPNKHRSAVTEEQVRRAKADHPDYNRYQLAQLLGCSEQTIDRRLNGNNIRGGKYMTQTRVKEVGGMLEDMAMRAGFYLYDRRIWVKDPAWVNSQWHSSSYRAVDEFEYIYIFWKPGITTVDRHRLTPKEWSDWGSRAVWQFPSVRSNDDHEAKFPLELPRRVIKLLSGKGEIVLDCFMGSGTTAVAAMLEGRQYIGIEALEQYVNLSRANVEKATSSPLLSTKSEPVEALPTLF